MVLISHARCEWQSLLHASQFVTSSPRELEMKALSKGPRAVMLTIICETSTTPRPGSDLLRNFHSQATAENPKRMAQPPLVIVSRRHHSLSEGSLRHERIVPQGIHLAAQAVGWRKYHVVPSSQEPEAVEILGTYLGARKDDVHALSVDQRHVFTIVDVRS